MPAIAELDLYHLPIGEQAFADDPNPFMSAAGSKHPWLAKSDFGVVITDYDAINEILGMDDKLKTPCEHLIEIMGGEGTNWARFERECLIARDGADHSRIRSAINRAFLPKAVHTYRHRIRTVISQLLDTWAPQGRFDCEEFASRFPVAVMFGLLGIPREKIEDVKHWLEMLGQSFSLDRSLFPAINESFERLYEFAEQLVETRLASGNAAELDVLDALLEGERAGTLSRMEVLDMILFLFAAGYDTSKNQLGHIVLFMLDRPHMWERCAEDRKFCDEVMDEALRHSGVATSYRNLVVDIEHRGVTFPAGTMLIFPLGIVCRYSGPFEDAMEFTPGRPNGRRYTAFSRGIHTCLGQFLARLQIGEGLHLMSQRLKNLRRDGEVRWRLFPGVWGPSCLPIAFDTPQSDEIGAQGTTV
jgi:cytochrome P450